MSEKSKSMASGVGNWYPLVAGAGGKAILANVSEARLDSILAKAEGFDAVALRRSLQEVRERGYATSHGETVEAAAAIAVAIRRTSGEVIGAINIVNVANGDLSPIDVEVGQALADVATIGLLQHRSVREARVLSEQLQVALTSRVILEQAKGVLSERASMDMPTAFGILRSYARARGLPLSEVAGAVVDGTLTHDALLVP